MQKIFLLLFIVVFGIQIALAQWTGDLAHPLEAATKIAPQTNLVTLTDSSGGCFTFWLDKRRDGTIQEIYGQHINSDGHRLWPDTGKLLLKNLKVPLWSVNAVATGNNNILLTWVSGKNGGDSLWAQLFTKDGAALWTTPTLIAGRNSSVPGGYIIYVDSPSLLMIGDGAYLAYYLTFVGGNSTIYINRIDGKGKLQWQKNGNPLPVASGGPFQLASDGKGKAFIYWRTSNGAGADLNVDRFDSSGVMLWSNPVNVSKGTPGLAYEFKGIEDGNHGLYLCWVQSGPSTDISLARVDTSGNLTFGVKPVCTQSNAQDHPDITISNGQVYVSWADARPPASQYDIYIQKMAADGNPVFTKDGIKISSLNTYIPYVKLAPASDGGVVAAYVVSQQGYAYQAQHVGPTGLLQWGTNGILVADAAHEPFYEQHQIIHDQAGNFIFAWHAATSSDKIYLSKMTGNGTVLSVEKESGKNYVTAYPNPTNRYFNIVAKENSRIVSAELQDIRGVKVAVPVKLQGNEVEFSLDNCLPGLYIYQLRTDDEKVISGKFLVVE